MHTDIGGASETGLVIRLVVHVFCKRKPTGYHIHMIHVHCTRSAVNMTCTKADACDTQINMSHIRIIIMIMLKIK